jgi:hypothetical protein
MARSAFAGFCFPPDVIVLAVRWYLRDALSWWHRTERGANNLCVPETRSQVLSCEFAPAQQQPADPSSRPARSGSAAQARLAELGFATLEAYLQDRYVRRGWSVRRLCAELGVGYRWMATQLHQLGLRT